MNQLPKNLAQRISPEPNTGCWLWTGTINEAGYGMMDVSGQKRRAHRLTYEHLRGPIPIGLDIDHLCRVRSCVNPDHLEPVTRKVNINRGVGPAEAGARMSTKTHCPIGHAYDESNTIYRVGGRSGTSRMRQCRTCQAAACARWRVGRDPAVHAAYMREWRKRNS